MSELASRILQVLSTRYKVGWSVSEGNMLYDVKQSDPTIVDLYRFPQDFDAALKELAQAKYIEKHPIFPDWKMLKLTLVRCNQ